jgi:hypothetical protein
VKLKTVLVAMVAMVSCCVDVRSESDELGQVVLLDVQGLWGGRDVWISMDGKAVCRLVTRPQKGQSGLQETRYSFELSKEQLATLAECLKKHNFLAIKTTDRYGVPDESRPVIFVKSSEGTHAVAKWANDKHKDFDPIYESLVKIAESGTKGTEIGQGSVERGWYPNGFPENKAIWNMTKTEPEKK